VCQAAGQVTEYQGSHRAELSRRSLRLLVLSDFAWASARSWGYWGKGRACTVEGLLIVFTGARRRLLSQCDPFAER
jgi:hypothetical protein